MDKQIKEAFDRIHAPDALKQETLEAVMARRSQRKSHTRLLRMAMACLAVVMLAGGYLSYALPVAAVSIDINPSVELQVNLYNRVVGVQGYNPDGEALAEAVSVTNWNYADAVEEILSRLEALVEAGGVVEITVASGSQSRAEEMEGCISQTTGVSGSQIYCMDSHHQEEAHEAGLSLGKYRVYLELLEQYPELTVEQVQDMTMEELHHLCEKEGQENHNGQENGNGQGNQNGQGNHNGQGHRGHE